jgi:phosphoribosyl-ATP pyrophosphohydrolase/phosphoribosyl-AMP cyclohydrolase
MRTIDELAWDDAGLLPAVVQDAASGEVLTVAYVSRDSLAKTRELGQTVFFSRSRGRLWHKGETSGNFQDVVEVAADCDLDAVVIRVRPRGPACHTGARSCFFEGIEGFAAPAAEGGAAAAEQAGPAGAVLAELERVIRARKHERPEGSYTARLFEKGRARILQKVGEEATETVIAGMSGDRDAAVKESADLLFHLLVALTELDIPLDDVAAELRARRK